MLRSLAVLLGLCLVLVFSTYAGAQSGVTVKVVHNEEYGDILADSKGMTLYMFVPDKPNESVCYGSCAQAWPPLILESGQPVAGEGVNARLGITTRRDGSRQVTVNGMPLYYFAGDKKPGDANGQGLNNVWWVLSASGQPIKAEEQAPSQAPAAGGGGMSGYGSTSKAPMAALALLGLAAVGLAYGARRWAR